MRKRQIIGLAIATIVSHEDQRTSSSSLPLRNGIYVLVLRWIVQLIAVRRSIYRRNRRDIMADDYAPWRPQAEADWDDEGYRVRFERLAAAGEQYFDEIRTENRRLRQALVAVCTTLDEQGRVAPGALETARLLVYPDGERREEA
jgi:hypothetical protein